MYHTNGVMVTHEPLSLISDWISIVQPSMGNNTLRLAVPSRSLDKVGAGGVGGVEADDGVRWYGVEIE